MFGMANCAVIVEGRRGLEVGEGIRGINDDGKNTLNNQ